MINKYNSLKSLHEREVKKNIEEVTNLKQQNEESKNKIETQAAEILKLSGELNDS